MDIIINIMFLLLGMLLYKILVKDCIKEGHCGTCLEDLKECSQKCSKPNECKIVGDKYKCVLPDKDEFILCKYIHIPFLCK
tara:strand:- start:399 stop:641 length:243 start_codon:yes stop_codon:yes gene_type:complete